VLTNGEASVDPLDEAPGQGLFLAALLSGQDAGRSIELAVNALLELWAEPPLSVAPASLQDALDELSARGISVTPIPQADLEAVRRLGYPALLTLQAGSGETRTVALVSLDDGIAELSGVRTGGGVLRVPVSAVEEQWSDGGAFVLWRSFHDVPEVIAEGDEGAGVLWLQEALGRLGHLDADITGRYDLDTVEGVQSFQRRHQLRADGVVGPLTLMLLFSELDEYAPPRLEVPGRG
jgi:general secretion pathway protein A